MEDKKHLMNWEELMCPQRARGSYKKRSSADLRTEFEKDYHRIISSASFRRLQDKTQVFPLDKSDFIRTRLTHSLEVASFAKSLGHNISSRIIEEIKDPDFSKQTENDICSVLECAGLLHDIGNPPFGHFGESAIQDWFKKNLPNLKYDGMPLTDLLNEQMIRDFYNFEGNTQALRVVTKLHFMVDSNGMNLTDALLSTIMKYPGSSLEINYDKNDPDRDIARKKMGYFYADRATYNRVVTNCNTNGRRHPLSFVLEAADDIAYKTADIEDSVKKKIFSLSTLIEELKSISDANRISEFIGNGEKPGESDMAKLIAKLEDYYKNGLECGYENPELYAVSNWLVRVQGFALSGATEGFISHYDEIMNGTYKKELLSGSNAEALMDALSDIAARYSFVTEPILKLEIAADTIFDFLLSRLVNALIYFDTPLWKEKATSLDKKMVGIISPTFMQVYRTAGEGIDDSTREGMGEKLYLRLLLATDYVSGMTDGYAKRLYQELNGIGNI